MIFSKKFFFLFFFLIYITKNIAEGLPEWNKSDTASTKTSKKNVYSKEYYLAPQQRINSNFMVATTQRVLYINYPYTLASESSTPIRGKDSNSAGIIILMNQPQGVTSSNVEKANIPVWACMTLNSKNEVLGWEFAIPSDYYEKSKDVMRASYYHKNIYFGRDSGPNHTLNEFSGGSSAEAEMIRRKLSQTGMYNIVIGNNSGHYDDILLNSYNTVIGSFSGNAIIGSNNSFIGRSNGFSTKNVLLTSKFSPEDLTKDYYDTGTSSNYNNVLGNYNLLVSIEGVGNKLKNIKQNTIIGNANLAGVENAYCNCIIGEKNFTSDRNSVNRFFWIDHNIVIGCDNLFFTSNKKVKQFYGNIVIIPHGGSSDEGGINLEEALLVSDDDIAIETNSAILIGSSGGPFPSDHSFKTYIGNIYASSLVETIYNTSDLEKKKNLGVFSGTSSFPIVTFVSSSDQLGQMEVLPYGEPDEDYIAEPGNIKNIDSYIIDYLLNKETMNILGVCLENDESAREGSFFFIIDPYNFMKDPVIKKEQNPFAAFVIYRPKQEKTTMYGAGKKKIIPIRGVSASEIEMTGFESYYIIPALVRGEQILYEKNQELEAKIINLEEVIAELRERVALIEEKKV